LQRAADILGQSADVAASWNANTGGGRRTIRARRAELGLGPLVIHANYLINLASIDSVMRVRAIQAFHDELLRATALGADFLVVHPGAALGARNDDACVLWRRRCDRRRGACGWLRILRT